MTGDESDGAPLERLASRRARIEEIDQRIITLLAERVAIGLETAALKRAAGLPILDPQREAEVIRRAVAGAREHALPEEAVRKLFWQVVGLSRSVQENES